MYLFELQRQRRRCFAVEIAAAPPLFYGGYRVDIEESGNDFYPFKLPDNKCAGGGFPGGRGPTGREELLEAPDMAQKSAKTTLDRVCAYQQGDDSNAGSRNCSCYRTLASGSAADTPRKR